MEDKNMRYTTTPPCQNRRSSGMAAASLILGIASLATSGCIYLALACGSLGIILALLSRGGTRTLDNQAIVGLVLSASGLVFTLCIYGTALFLMYHLYGGWDGILKEYMNIYGAETMEELYQILGIY